MNHPKINTDAIRAKRGEVLRNVFPEGGPDVRKCNEDNLRVNVKTYPVAPCCICYTAALPYVSAVTVYHIQPVGGEHVLSDFEKHMMDS